MFSTAIVRPVFAEFVREKELHKGTLEHDQVRYLLEALAATDYRDAAEEFDLALGRRVSQIDLRNTLAHVHDFVDYCRRELPGFVGELVAVLRKHTDRLPTLPLKTRTVNSLNLSREELKQEFRYLTDKQRLYAGLAYLGHMRPIDIALCSTAYLDQGKVVVDHHPSGHGSHTNPRTVHLDVNELAEFGLIGLGHLHTPSGADVDMTTDASQGVTHVMVGTGLPLRELALLRWAHVEPEYREEEFDNTKPVKRTFTVYMESVKERFTDRKLQLNN